MKRKKRKPTFYVITFLGSAETIFHRQDHERAQKVLAAFRATTTVGLQKYWKLIRVRQG